MYFQNNIRGKVWKFGDDISTDLIMPGHAVLSNPNLSDKEAIKYCMMSNRPGWWKLVNNGDIIIAGKNFGCGSSRPASKILKAMGLSVIIAESVSRIFFRNSINIGLPVITCNEITKYVEEGDMLKINLINGEIINENSKRMLYGESIPINSPPMEILKSGGIINYLQMRQRKEKKNV